MNSMELIEVLESVDHSCFGYGYRFILCIHYQLAVITFVVYMLCSDIPSDSLE
jgi:hypothetical protein